jgi:hypothetical protein
VHEAAADASTASWRAILVLSGWSRASLITGRSPAELHPQNGPFELWKSKAFPETIESFFQNA